MIAFLAITLIIIVAIAGWAGVASAQALAKGRAGGSDQLSRQLDELYDTIAQLRDDVETIASKQQTDHQMLEERLDFTERMLTQAKNRP